jgi:anti-sigma regulatory factor (Ser/Thr protein kinase)
MTSAGKTLAQVPGRTEIRRTYPGDPAQVGQVRRDLAQALGAFSLADELTLIASELCANAVVHSRSGQAGGRFTVHAQVCPDDFAWIEVQDEGGAWHDCKHTDDRPHGLDIVQALAGAGSWGIDANGSRRVVWVRLDWPNE